MYIQCNGTPFVSTIEYIGPHIISTTSNSSSNFSFNIPLHVTKIIPINVTGNVIEYYERENN